MQSAIAGTVEPNKMAPTNKARTAIAIGFPMDFDAAVAADGLLGFRGNSDTLDW